MVLHGSGCAFYTYSVSVSHSHTAVICCNDLPWNCRGLPVPCLSCGSYFFISRFFFFFFNDFFGVRGLLLRVRSHLVIPFCSCLSLCFFPSLLFLTHIALCLVYFAISFFVVFFAVFCAGQGWLWRHWAPAHYCHYCYGALKNCWRTEKKRGDGSFLWHASIVREYSCPCFMCPRTVKAFSIVRVCAPGSE